MMAPQDWVEKAIPIWPPLALRLFAKKVPRVTNQPPQIKNCKNIMMLSRVRIMAMTSSFVVVVENVVVRLALYAPLERPLIGR